MHFSRPLSSTLTLMLVGALTACATSPGQSLSTGTVGPALTQPVAPVPVTQTARSETQTSEVPTSDVVDEENRDPVIIRGNDRTHLAKPGSGKPIKGPATSLKFENAPSGEVVHVMLRDMLKMDYVVHPPLAGNITLNTRGEVSADKALLLLETALQVNGIVMAQDSRGTYHVGTPESLKGVVAAPRLADSRGMAPGYGAIIISPQYLGVGEMANILRPMVPAEAIVRVDNVRNILVMRGTRAEAEGWMDIVKTFDVNLLRGMSVGVFPLKHSSVEDVQAALNLLAGGSGAATGAPGAAPAQTPRPGAPAQQAGRPGQAGQAAASAGGSVTEINPLFGAVRIMPIERINAIMVVTPRAAYLDEIRYWIEQFDRPNLNSAEPQLFVYKVRNGSADHLAELLNGIYSGTNAFGGPGATGATGVAPGLGGAAGSTGRSATGGTNNLGRYSTNQNTQRQSALSGSRGGFGNSSLGSSGGLGNNLRGGAGAQNTAAGAAGGAGIGTVALSDSVRVMADYINNTLLIHAKPSEYARIESTLKRLDIPRAQVLIEASIVEVQLTEGMTIGTKWNFKAGGAGYGGAGGVGSNFGSNGPSAVALDSLTSTMQGSNVGSSLANGFTYVLRNSANPIALLQAESSTGNVRFLSNPSLMVMDNHTAAISVGEQIPVQTASYTNGTTSILTSNYEFKDTGVILNITPQVNSGNLVTMEIDQEVTDLGTFDDAAQRYRFKQRTLSSKVAVRSGETMVLGGLVKTSDTKSKGGLPVLSSIPLVGALFGTHKTVGDRTELLLVITPRVIRSDEEAREVSQELRDRMKGISDSGWSTLGAPNSTPSLPKPTISIPQEGQNQ